MSGFADSESFRNLIRTHPKIAIRQLYEHYYKPLVHIAEYRTHDRKASEDIVQEAFVSLWKRAEWLAGQKKILIGPYLMAMVKKKAITHYRQGQRFPSVSKDGTLDTFHSTRATREAEIIKSDRYAILRSIVSNLPRRERECIQMRFFWEMSIDSISTALGISRKSVEKGITKGLKRLRQHKSSMH